MSNRVTPDGLFHATIKLAPNKAKLKEIDMPVVVARTADQATTFAMMAVRTLGLVPKAAGHDVRQLNPRETVRTRRIKRDD